MDIATQSLRLLVVLATILLVPIVLVLATPFVLLRPRPESACWTHAVRARYRNVNNAVWDVAVLINTQIP